MTTHLWPSIEEILSWCDQEGIPHRGVTFVDPSDDDVFDIQTDVDGSLVLVYTIRQGKHSVLRPYSAWCLQAKLRTCVRAPHPDEDIKVNRAHLAALAERDRREREKKAEEERKIAARRLEICREMLMARGHSAEALAKYTDDQIVTIGVFLDEEARQRADQEARLKAEAAYRAREAEREHERAVERAWENGYVFTQKGTWAPRKMNDMRGVWGVYPPR